MALRIVIATFSPRTSFIYQNNDQKRDNKWQNDNTEKKHYFNFPGIHQKQRHHHEEAKFGVCALTEGDLVTC